MQGPQGLLLSFVGAQTVPASQAAAVGGVSAARQYFGETRREVADPKYIFASSYGVFSFRSRA